MDLILAESDITNINAGKPVSAADGKVLSVGRNSTRRKNEVCANAYIFITAVTDVSITIMDK